MTTAIAWGTSYWGWVPQTEPFVAGAEGSLDNIPLIWEGFTFGPTEPLSDASITVEHRFAPADGGPEYVVDTLYLDSDYTSQTVRASAGQSNGIHTLTALSAGAALPVQLVLAVASGDGMYGSAAWYEEAIVPPVFWTLLVAAEETP